MAYSEPGHGASVFFPGASSLARKLSLYVPLSDSDQQVLDSLTTSDEHFRADADIVREGMVPRSVFLLQEGMAVRYRNLPDGRRQIMTFLIPGDLCEPHMFLLRTMDHSIGTITPVRIASLSREGLVKAFSTRPRISAALWWSSLQEEAMLRERIVALGRRDARGRVAYLMCELLWRYTAMGLAEHEAFRLPLTQVDIADVLGLTAVHVNRVLKKFREEALIAVQNRLLHLLDVVSLQEIAGFNMEYLHLDGPSPEVARYFNQVEAEQPSDNDPLFVDRITALKKT